MTRIMDNMERDMALWKDGGVDGDMARRGKMVSVGTSLACTRD
mgnify:CR=1 FL=1